jgi:cellulose biosynthesis protein BcsQ
MYTVTFYSFKGGVGRSLAVANVGAHLASTGRKVLLVDFDLEAPGLDTFSEFEPPKSTRGIVDFVYEYLQTGIAPKAEDFSYNCEAFSAQGGALWIMPAGVRKEASFAERLASLSWQRLYSEQDGYLLFEELKSQWQHIQEFDYVLIDSRTGYSDVAGICTRQLPDSVVILFFPNDQNLGGLKEIVSGIREEAAEPRRKKIRLHFVTSNIPDLDDEDQILARRISQFKQQLGYEDLTAAIHHYPSLALLNQVVFTHKRPRSRLAREYRSLCREILRHNLRDREGALSFMATYGDSEAYTRSEDLDKALEEIRTCHASDGEVLGKLGSIYLQLGRDEWALNLLNEATLQGFETGALALDRARLLFQSGQQDQAIASAEKVLSLRDSKIFEVNSAVRLLLKVFPSALQALPTSPALNALSPYEKSSIAKDLMTSRDNLLIAERILRDLLIIDRSGLINIEAQVIEPICKLNLILCLIGQGKFKEAMMSISASSPVPAALEVVDAFNYGMAQWGTTHICPADFFDRVAQCDATSRLDRSPNLLQCASLTHWILGNHVEARKRLQEARDMLESHPQPKFSAWRYLVVASRDFKKDLDAMESMFDGAPILPEVLSLSVNTTTVN